MENAQMQQSATRAVGGVRLGLGLALLAVPVVATVIAYVLPTFRTLGMSFEEGDSAGANYEAVLLGGEYLGGFATIAGTTFTGVLVGAVIAPLIAWCVHNAGSATRMAARIFWGVAAIAFAPAVMAAALLHESVADNAMFSLELIDWNAIISGVILGAGGLVALAAFRGGTDTGKRAATVVTAAGLSAIALVAAGIQTFSFPHLLGFPRTGEMTPIPRIFNDGFRTAQLGTGAAMSTVMLVVLALLGIGAALLFILARIRIDVSPEPDEPRRFRLGAGIGAIVLLALLAVAVTTNLAPWLTRIGDAPNESIDGAEAVTNAWGSALLTTSIALVAALAGGFAIGALRPLGDGSKWLLLLFAPWLFVGTGPLVLANYEAVSSDLSAFITIAPRAWIAVPALFVFTALFWGLEDRRRSRVEAGWSASKAGGAFASAAWPMVALVGMGVWLVNAQDTVWQLTVGWSDHPTGIVRVLESMNRLELETTGISLGYPPVLLGVFGAAMALASVFYLPRVGIRVGR